MTVVANAATVARRTLRGSTCMGCLGTGKGLICGLERNSKPEQLKRIYPLIRAENSAPRARHRRAPPELRIGRHPLRCRHAPIRAHGEDARVGLPRERVRLATGWD